MSQETYRPEQIMAQLRKADVLPVAGVPVKVVSEHLGHSTPAFTMTVHQLILPMSRDAAQGVFGSSAKPARHLRAVNGWFT